MIIGFLLFLAKKMKDTLSSFLPQLPGVIDVPGNQDNSSLRGLIDKPPGKTQFSIFPLIVLCWALVGLEPCKEKILSSLIHGIEKSMKHEKKWLGLGPIFLLGKP